MNTKIFSAYLLIAVSFFGLTLTASENKTDTAPLTYEQQKEQAIDNVRHIIREFDILKLGIDAIKTNKLSTEELLLKIISVLNFTIKVRAYLLSIAPVEKAVGHEMFHATNHISNINEELDLAENGGLDARKSYVRLYRYSLPVMLNIMQDVTLKALNALKSNENIPTEQSENS